MNKRFHDTKLQLIMRFQSSTEQQKGRVIFDYEININLKIKTEYIGFTFLKEKSHEIFKDYCHIVSLQN